MLRDIFFLLTIIHCCAKIHKSAKLSLFIWVWRSLVACLNGVQEAGGSNPLTQTMKEHRNFMFSMFFNISYPQFTRKTVRRHKICVLRRCFDSSPVHFPFKRVLPGANFMSSDSAAEKKNFFIFKADQESVIYECAD